MMQILWWGRGDSAYSRNGVVLAAARWARRKGTLSILVEDREVA